LVFIGRIWFVQDVGQSWFQDTDLDLGHWMVSGYGFFGFSVFRIRDRFVSGFSGFWIFQVSDIGTRC
jgi:hypothetical protein